MTARRKVGNPLALAVLAWLVLEPMHPYELGRRLEESEQDRSVNYNRGSLYMVVKQLAKAEFIAARETVRDGRRPERTVYELTAAGHAELYDWLGELVSRPRDEYPSFGVALSLLSVLPPPRAVELLRARSTALAELVAETRARVEGATEQGVAWMFLVEEHYRIAQLETESRFVTELVEELERPDYIRTWQETFGSRT